MRRLTLFILPFLLAVSLAACGNVVDPGPTTVATPPQLPTPASGEKAVPVDTSYGRHRCVHYHYVTDDQGRRHRAPCPTPRPGPSPNPAPTPGPGPYKPASGCGVERWAVKTLTDPGARAVTLTPRDTTLAALVAFRPPINPTDRVSPVETNTWRIRVHLTAFKQEADSDIHLAVADDQGNTGITEFPSPSCDSGSVVASQIKAARDAFTARYGQATNRYQTIHGDATITGVGFFDRLHGQRGVAPNGIELHPVTGFSG